MKIVFESKISKMGEYYLVKIPKPLKHMVKELHGKKVKVVIEYGEK